VTSRRRSTRLAAAALLTAVATLAGGCASDHHVLDPASEAAAAIEWLWWILFAVSVVVFVVVLALWAYAFLRHRSTDAAPGDSPHAPEPTGNALRWVLTGAVITAVTVLGLTAVTVLVGARISAAAHAADGLVVEVIGHQYWWEVRYPEAGVVTANEIHIPAGEPTRFRLMSNDVIHSLWVPRLHGKLDLTPGRVGDLVLHPEEPGTYRGFCAEFCGAQHALMGLLIIAQPRDEFEAWLEAQARPAQPPADADARAGIDAFVRHDCVHCHTIRGGGLDRRSQGTGPDLTHLASRRTLGAVTVENTAENLEQWIVDPHTLKRGVLMPATRLEPAERRALLRFLEGLR
jgi:cytochrome c oxidase subunit II